MVSTRSLSVLRYVFIHSQHSTSPSNSIQMVFFSAFMIHAYGWHEYKIPGKPRTSIWRPLWDRSVPSILLLILFVSSRLSQPASVSISVRFFFLFTYISSKIHSPSSSHRRLLARDLLLMAILHPHRTRPQAPAINQHERQARFRYRVWYRRLRQARARRIRGG